MYDWTVMLGSYLSSRVYRVDSSFDEGSVLSICERNGLDLTMIDLRAVRNRSELLDAFARALAFPSYFGANWDALNDCLTDMSWKPADGYVLLLIGLQGLLENADAGVAPVVAVLQSVADSWRQRGIPFFVILSR